MLSQKSLLSLCAIIGALSSCFAAEYPASSAAEITHVAKQLLPGDVVILKDGTWKDQALVFQAKGTAAKPIILRAQTPGKVVFTGASSLLIDGEYLVVGGLYLKECESKDGVAIRGRNCRFT